MPLDVAAPAEIEKPSAESVAPLVECLLFASGEPLTPREIGKAVGLENGLPGELIVHEAVRILRDRLVRGSSGLHIVEIANGYQMATRPEHAQVVGKLLAPHANRLSKPALETVTIVAYQQPCTQAEIEAVRGVASDGVLKTLVERELVKEAGRKATPGRPILYETTPAFLHYFGLAALSDLPVLDEDEIAANEAESREMAHTALVAAGVEDRMESSQ